MRNLPERIEQWKWERARTRKVRAHVDIGDVTLLNRLVYILPDRAEINLRGRRQVVIPMPHGYVLHPNRRRRC